MKQWISGLLALTLCLALAACGSEPDAGTSQAEAATSAGTPEVSSASQDASSAAGDAPASDGASAATADSLALVEQMMTLDYQNLTVEEFNQAIVQICDKADTNIFQVIADVYDQPEPLDRDTGAFMHSTLEYSAQQLFGEPVYLGSVSYILTAGETAAGMLQKQQEMEPAAWDAYFDSVLGDITTYNTAFYEVDFNVLHPGQLLVAQRDDRLNALRAGMEEYVTGMSPEEMEAEGAADSITARLEELAAAGTDPDMELTARLQNLERSAEMQ